MSGIANSAQRWHLPGVFLYIIIKNPGTSVYLRSKNDGTRITQIQHLPARQGFKRIL